jgi:hypothetical protein
MSGTASTPELDPAEVIRYLSQFESGSVTSAAIYAVAWPRKGSQSDYDYDTLTSGSTGKSAAQRLVGKLSGARVFVRICGRWQVCAEDEALDAGS